MREPRRNDSTAAAIFLLSGCNYIFRPGVADPAPGCHTNIFFIMRTYKFKTLRGLVRSASGQLTAENLFSGRVYLSNGRGWCNVVLSDRARLEAAEMFAAYCVASKSRRADMVEALAGGRGDFSLFQCFYLVDYGHGLQFTNSLSGSAFEWCKREYLRRYC